MKGARGRVTWFVAAFALLASCRESPTEIVVEIFSEVECARQPIVGVAVARDVRALDRAPLASRSTSCAPSSRVGSVVIEPASSADEAVAFQVLTRTDGQGPETCDASRDYAGCIVARRRLSFAAGRTLRARVDLRLSCLDVACLPEQTCELGQCVGLDTFAPCEGEGCTPGGPATLPDGGPVPGVDGGRVDGGRVDGAEPFGVAVAIEAGAAFTCAVSASGLAKCWGASGSGQLGQGLVVDRGGAPDDVARMAPIRLGTGANVSGLGAGDAHVCARTPAPRCWGANTSGQLGLGDLLARGTAPEQMGDALPAVDLVEAPRLLRAGGQHSCAVLEGGGVKCWGENGSGQLGIGSNVDRGGAPGEMGAALPRVALGAGVTVTDLALGKNHGCAVLGDGRVKCWGANGQGQLGLGDASSRGTSAAQMGDALPAVALGTGRTARAIAAGGDTTCALLDDGGVKCWGDNFQGKLGLGDIADRGTAGNQMGDKLPYVALGSGRTAKRVAVGGFHACALLDDGRVKCWGLNGSGQLGLGDKAPRGTTAGQMGDALPAVDLGAGRTAVEIAAGDMHTCALLDDARVKCWGVNTNGQLGIGAPEVGGKAGEMGDALPAVKLDL